MLKRWFAWAAALHGSEEREALLSRDQAKAILDQEIARRGWAGYDPRNYTMTRSEGPRSEGRAVWRCRGLVSGDRGGVNRDRRANRRVAQGERRRPLKPDRPMMRSSLAFRGYVSDRTRPAHQNPGWRLVGSNVAQFRARPGDYPWLES